MARIRVKGIPDFIEVPQEELKAFAEKRESKQIGDKDWIHLGRWQGEASSITAIILEEKSNTPEFTGIENHINERNRILSDLSTEQLADRQRKFYNFFCFCFGFNPSEEDWQEARQLAYSFLKNHQQMVWCDVAIWLHQIKEKAPQKDIEHYRAGGLKTIERVVSNEYNFQSEWEESQRSLLDSIPEPSFN